MKLIEVLQARKTLIELGEDHLPFSLSYKIMKFIKETENDVEFYRENHLKWLDKYFDKCETDQNKFVTKQGIDIKECNSKLDEINNVEVECSIFFTETELKPLNLTLPQMLSLCGFIKEKQE